jgi:hypothetical protein
VNIKDSLLLGAFFGTYCAAMTAPIVVAFKGARALPFTPVMFVAYVVLFATIGLCAGGKSEGT